MKSMLLRNIVRPLIERLGTMLAVYLMAKAIDSDTAAVISNGVVALLALAFDWIVSRLFRDADKAKVAHEILSRADGRYWPPGPIEPQFGFGPFVGGGENRLPGERFSNE